MSGEMSRCGQNVARRHSGSTEQIPSISHIAVVTDALVALRLFQGPPIQDGGLEPGSTMSLVTTCQKGPTCISCWEGQSWLPLDNGDFVGIVGAGIRLPGWGLFCKQST